MRQTLVDPSGSHLLGDTRRLFCCGFIHRDYARRRDIHRMPVLLAIRYAILKEQ